MKLVVLTGIPGSGSTTLLNKALEEVDYVHLILGDIMTEFEYEEKIFDYILAKWFHDIIII